jgi:hypothetical protein
MSGKHPSPGRVLAGDKASARQAVSARRRELEARRAAQRKRAVRIQVGLIAAALLAVAGTVVAIVVATHHAHKPANSAQSGQVPVWPAPAPAKVSAAVAAAGLPMLTMEASDVHFHVHLDILDHGQLITVPADIGIAGATSLSALHTHDSTGIVHIESPTQRTFTLGQLFTEWQQRLSSSCVGTLCATSANPLHFYVNGTVYTGDPTQIRLAPHQEIAIIYGGLPSGRTPPPSFTFPAGL